MTPILSLLLYFLAALLVTLHGGLAFCFVADDVRWKTVTAIATHLSRTLELTYTNCVKAYWLSQRRLYSTMAAMAVSWVDVSSPSDISNAL